MTAPDPTLLKGPGLLYVQSRIARTDVLDEATFFKWYDEDHIDEIIQTSGIKSAFRYCDTDYETRNARKEKSLLAIYPLDDLSFLLSDEFRGIRVKSDMLPETGIVYDLAEFDVRYLGLVHKTERKKKAESMKCLVIFGVEPGPGTSEQEVEDWFRREVSISLHGTKCSSLMSCSTSQPLRQCQDTFVALSSTSSMLEQMLNQEH